MGQLKQASVFAAIAVATSGAWGQTAADLYDAPGRAVGQSKGDSVVIQYNNQPVRIYLGAHYDYAAGRPLSSGLTWRPVPVYYQSSNCTGQAYIGTAPVAPIAATQTQTPSQTQTPTTNQTQTPSQTTAAGPGYSPPAYGSHYLVAPSLQGTTWTAYISAQDPAYTQQAIQSERQYDGSCAARSYPSLWVTPAQATVPLANYGTPPFYVR